MKTNQQKELFDLNLTNETKSLLLFKKYMEDSNYRELVNEKFKFSYYSEYPIAVAINILIRYNKKFGTVPNADTLKDMVRKAVEGKPKFDPTLINATVDNALNLNIEADEEFIKSSIVNFIASTNTYNIILDNIETIKSQKDVSYLLNELAEIENIKLEKDNFGLNYFDDFSKHLEDLSNPEQRIPTGYERLDKLLNGGWLKNGRMLALFLAPSHLGKSLFLSNLAVNSLKQGKFAVIISLEMSELVYATRIDAHVAKQDINSLTLELERLETNVKKFKNLHPNGQLVIKEFAAKTVSAKQLTEYLKKLQEEVGRKIDIIYLDYLTLLRPQASSYKDGLYENGAAVTIEARAMSYELNCPVISAVQGNRSTFNSDENVGMETVSESIAIAQTADVMISLFQTDSLRAENLIGFEMSKNRLGGCVGEGGHFTVDYKTLTITEAGNDVKNKSDVKRTKGDLSKILESEEDFENV